MAVAITTSEIGSTQHQIFNNVELAAAVYQRVVEFYIRSLKEIELDSWKLLLLELKYC